MTAIGAATPREVALGAMAAALAEVGIADPRREARLVLLAALDIPAGELLARPQVPLGADADRLRDVLARRLRREPLSRILGRREFFGLSLAINPQVLDPRPDTEILVEAILHHASLRALASKTIQILDLGAGSGAILAALLRHLPCASGLASDCSPEALAVARINLESLGLATRGRTLLSDWFDRIDGRFDIIASNPPYIASGILAGLAPEVRDYDPDLALDGGDDGLGAYRILAASLRGHLEAGGFAAFEVGAGQAPKVAAIFSDVGFRTLDIWRDLGGIERVVLVDHPA